MSDTRICVVGAGLAGTLLAWRLARPDGRPGRQVDLVTGRSVWTREDATGVSGGVVRAFETDPRLAAVFILSAMNAMAHWYRPDGAIVPDALAEHYADLFLSGLQPSERTP